jgi:hypothetical protein
MIALTLSKISAKIPHHIYSSFQDDDLIEYVEADEPLQFDNDKFIASQTAK